MSNRNMLTPPPIKSSDRIRTAIENDIRSGKLLPGELIDETAVAHQFKVSRTPVREALLQLEAQGLLISRPRQGYVVAKMNVQQLLALWELLAELEGICVRLACERMTDEERQELAEVHNKAQSIVEENDIESWRDANHDFHDVLYRGCRNPFLREELLRLRTMTSGYLQHAFSALGRLQTSYKQHERILEAILKKDAQLAYNEMLQHISLEQGSGKLLDFLINLPKSLIQN